MSGGGMRALLFGGSGQVGAAVLARLLHGGWQVDALSRAARPRAHGVRWLRGGFDAMPALSRRYDAIVSCGPLDRFAHWHAGAGIAAPRVVAFGSTSLAVKQGSADGAERDLAARLGAAEAALFAAARGGGAEAIVLRPTLVYGAARDQTLSRIAAIAGRYRAFPLPRGARGLRQPVHVDDLAAAAVAAIHARGAGGRGYDLPGGETLPYREMVARVLASLDPPRPLLELPMPLFRALLAVARTRGIARQLTDEAIARMRENLVFDAVPAQRDFGYAPRDFIPAPGMFDP